MLAIVAILLLGSVFWSALGALVSAMGDARSAFPLMTAPKTVSSSTPRAAAPPATATPVPLIVATVPPTAVPTATPEPTPQPQPTVSLTPEATATPEATPESGERAPWVLLPQPAPGAKVNSGPVLVEARGRGDAPITEIRLELDGAALPVAVEQRSDVIWRGSTTVPVSPGKHAVRALVIDARGRSGSYRWTFEAGN
jgi:hypothetical protein